MPSAFEQLLPCSWRDIQFPISAIRVSFAQDIAEHKYWGVDGVNVEATGRGAMQIEVTIPLYNGIVPGKGESWGVLYPTTFQNIIRAMADHSTGVFVHVELGEITCKPVNFEVHHDPMRRDGVEVTARFIETLIDGDDGKIAVGNSPVQVAELAALDLDASGDDIKSLAPKAPVFEESFDSMINKVTGSIDKLSTAATLAAGRPGQMLSRLNQLGDSLDRAKSALLWPAMDAVTRMQGAVIDVGNTITKGRRTVLRFTTKVRSTLAVLSGQFPGNTVDDLINLNPNLLSSPDVGVGVVVRYYAK